MELISILICSRTSTVKNDDDDKVEEVAKDENNRKPKNL